MIHKGKGIKPTSLKEPWQELATIVHKYITCGGRQDVVWSRHLKMLAILRKKIVVNLPFFFNSLLHDVASRVRKAKNPHATISHHGLIKLIFTRELT